MKVLAAAQELDYQVNHVAASLRKQVTDTIGLVVPEIGNPFFPALVESVEQHLGQKERQLLLCDSRLDPELESKRLDALMTHQVDGILISPCDAVKSREAIMSTAARIPLVQLDREVEDERIDWVGTDDAVGLKAVVGHLADRGARSAIFVSAEPTNSSARRRLKGFLDAAFEFSVGVAGVLLGSFTLAWGIEVAGRIASGSTLPDAVVCGNDLIAIGLIREFALLGIHIPDDLMVTGFDDVGLAQFFLPSLTTVHQPYNEIAARALDLLDGAGSRVARERQRVAIAPVLVIRESSTERAKSSAGIV